MTPFAASGKEAFWKHCGKRRNCLNKQFLLFPQCFLLYQRQKLSFLLYLIFRLQMLSIWSGPKFVMWERVNPFPNKPWSLRVFSISLLKTLWVKEKLLARSNFSYSLQYVFSTSFENFLPFISNLELLSANSFNLEESKICLLGKG